MTILEEIQEERKRQDDKWGEQNHTFTDFSPTTATAVANASRHYCDEQFRNGTGSWQYIIEEELYESLEQAALGNVKEFREELIQTAAVVVAMIECLDRNGLK